MLSLYRYNDKVLWFSGQKLSQLYCDLLKGFLSSHTSCFNEIEGARMGRKESHGMSGKALIVDLSNNHFHIEEIPQKDLDQFLGGRGLGAAILYRELPPKVDPLSEQNILVFSTGPLTATNAPASSRYCLTTKSPLTDQYLYSISGGYFGPELKRTGFDALVIKGKACQPVYLSICDSGVEFKDASCLWGMTTDSTQEFIKSDLHDESVRIACIGPAGENLVPYACVINERRALGRGGGGAVMGSKNLKAIAVRGTNKVSVGCRNEFREAVKKAFRGIQENPVTEAFATHGSSSLTGIMNILGIMPARNWQGAPSPDLKDIVPNNFRKNYFVKDVSCAPGCPIKCSKFYLAKDGNHAGALSEGPEYETLYALGTACEIYDAQTIIAADSFCDRYGLDTMSAGISIAFAMECFEKGIIDKDMTEGIELKFGNAELLIPLLQKIAYRNGFGEILALGTSKMAERFGKGSEDFAMHVKGMELGAYDPRGAKGMGLTYACGPRGGCHHAGGYSVIEEATNRDYDRFSERGKARLVKETRDKRSAACDSGSICGFAFAMFDNEITAEMISAATGLRLSMDDIRIIGERIACVERAFNVREGLKPEHDRLPRRLLNEEFTAGPLKGQTVDLEVLKEEFYHECGWDNVTGMPVEEKLKELDLDRLIRS